MNQTMKVIKSKLGVLELARQLGNVKEACQIMGYSCDSYYRFKKRFCCINSGRLAKVALPVF